MKYSIDKLCDGDWERVRSIYLEGIATGNATFETDAPGWETWDRHHHSFARIVARDEESIIGWAAISPISSRVVYAGVAEVSVYVAGWARGAGIGRELLTALIYEAELNGVWTLQAGILPENVASISLHKSCGFREVGRREKLSKLNGIWRDVILLERRSHKIGIE